MVVATLGLGGAPAIELDVSTYLPGCDREVKAFVDRIFWDSLTEQYVGVDFKSGSSMGKEDQFGTYRACLMEELGVAVDRWATFRVRDNTGRRNGKAPGLYPHERTLEHWTPEYAGHLMAQVSRGIDAEVFPPRLDGHCTAFCDVQAACYAAGGELADRYDPDAPGYHPEF
jgi:putative RecB family exonuclease